jgi:hypothetical protein
LVATVLPLAITFHLPRMDLAILFPVSRVSLTPLLGTLPADLPIDRIGGELVPVIIPAALPLALGLAANQLLGMISGRLKDLLTVTTTATIHQAAPDQNANRSF